MAWLFVYGTLQDPQVLAKLLGRIPPMQPAYVRGFARYRFSDASYPGAVTEATGVINGRLLGPLTDVEQRTLDLYEGERYEQRACGVHLGDASREGASVSPDVQARIYIVVAAWRARLSSEAWELKDWQRSERRAFLASL